MKAEITFKFSRTYIEHRKIHVKIIGDKNFINHNYDENLDLQPYPLTSISKRSKPRTSPSHFPYVGSTVTNKNLVRQSTSNDHSEIIPDHNICIVAISSCNQAKKSLRCTWADLSFDNSLPSCLRSTLRFTRSLLDAKESKTRDDGVLGYEPV